jgi:hypothetical protein
LVTVKSFLSILPEIKVDMDRPHFVQVRIVNKESSRVNVFLVVMVIVDLTCLPIVQESTMRLDYRKVQYTAPPDVRRIKITRSPSTSKSQSMLWKDRTLHSSDRPQKTRIHTKTFIERGTIFEMSFYICVKSNAPPGRRTRRILQVLDVFELILLRAAFK